MVRSASSVALVVTVGFSRVPATFARSSDCNPESAIKLAIKIGLSDFGEIGCKHCEQCTLAANLGRLMLSHWCVEQMHRVGESRFR